MHCIRRVDQGKTSLRLKSVQNKITVMYRYGVNRNETMSCKRAYYNPMKGPVGQLGPEENPG